MAYILSKCNSDIEILKLMKGEDGVEHFVKAWASDNIPNEEDVIK